MRISAALLVFCLLASPAIGAELGDLPDPTLTKGLSRPGLTLEKICATKWGSDARHVSDAVKLHVFQSYGLSGNDDPYCTPHGPNANPKRRCEIDHLISRELGGADDVTNLWPERYDPSLKWNATHKDQLENRLGKEICTKTVSLKEARDGIVKDWRGLYRKYFGEPK